MSPATVRYPLRDIKLLLVNDNERKCTYWMYPLINSGSVRLVDMVRKFRPDEKIPSGAVYTQAYKKCKALERLGYVRLERRSRIDWDKTDAARIKARDNSVQNIFRAAVQKDTPPIVSTGTLSGETDSVISTVKVQENRLYVVPCEKLFALISRLQNSNHFLNCAKSRREMQDAREKTGCNFAKLSLQKKRHCPYYLSARTKQPRVEAVFTLMGIRRHSMFKRRDKRNVNPELVKALEPVQSHFEDYIKEIEGRQIVLQHKETGAVKFMDLQTRFTDRTRQDGTIARYHSVWEKAGEGYNTGVMLTLTSYPPSEVPKKLYRKSALHVNRHFGDAWNHFLSQLTKWNAADRRDELLDLKRAEIKKTRPYRLNKNGQITLTRQERRDALLPINKKHLCDLKLEEIRKTEPDRIELTKEEHCEAVEPANFRPKFMQVYEFQKNGLLHGHSVFFGKSYLRHWKDIVDAWRRTGQGERIYVYAIQKDGDRWIWQKAQPNDARNRQPVDYLGKYLGKGVRTRGGYGLYWGINKRFFTNSRAFTEERELPDQTEKISSYEFIGTTRNDEIPPWMLAIHKGRSRVGVGWSDPLGWDSGGGTVPA